jgi:hypothetical protein
MNPPKGRIDRKTGASAAAVKGIQWHALGSIVEPDAEARLLVVVTVYEVSP